MLFSLGINSLGVFEITKSKNSITQCMEYDPLVPAAFWQEICRGFPIGPCLGGMVYIPGH